jgi:drug/metabolite transporter (DMT)-like permease
VSQPAGSVARAIGLMIVSVGFFQIMTILIKYLGARYPVGQIATFRGLFALLPLAPAIWRMGSIRALKVRRPAALAARSACGLASMLCVFYSITLLPLADYTALWFIFPLVIAAFSGPVLGERVGLVRWVAISVGFAGVVVVAQPTGTAGLGPAMIVLAGATIGAFAMLALRSLSLTEPAPVIVFHYMLFTAVLSPILLGRGWVMPDPLDAALLVSVGIAGGFGQILLTRSYQFAPAAVVAPFEYAALPLAIGLGYWFWNEIPGANAYLGGTVIVSAGLYLLYYETRSKPA